MAEPLAAAAATASRPAPSVAAVVVNYNAAAYLTGCVASLRAEGLADVVVVDNGSVDGSGEVMAAADPGARFLPTGRNLGYGGGANVGIRATASDHVLVCNADLTIEPGAVSAMVAALEADPRRGIVGPLIRDPDGSLYPSVRTFPALGDAIGHAFLGLVAPDNRWSRRYKMLGWDHAVPAEVDWVSGACFLARRRLLDELGGFDEAYFMYSEDVDLCWRAWRAGWKVAYEPAAEVVHVQGVSANRHPYRMIAAHHRSLLRFAARTTTGWRRGLLPVVAAGLALRALLAMVQRGAEGWSARRGSGPGRAAPGPTGRSGTPSDP
ncbi:MAG TPA: glycosyltransferase family 2 protein [Acidimicrobiales bacterium]|nr:glycosyltransferase family 2 protein [Acidimicrobiales bacterium]